MPPLHNASQFHNTPPLRSEVKWISRQILSRHICPLCFNAYFTIKYCNRLLYKDEEHISAPQDDMSAEDLSMLALENYRAAVRAGWDDKDLELVTATHVMAVLLGALD